MLEPLAADLKRRGIAGDFIEAGVYRGGISIAMAAILSAQGDLSTRRQMWLADSFAGMPDPETYTKAFVRRGRDDHALNVTVESVVSHRPRGKTFPLGLFRGNVSVVEANFARCFTPYEPTAPAAGASPVPPGVRLLRGFFADTLPTAPPAPLALIRADSDIYSSVYETLHHLYPRLAVGGFVVFDDYKIAEAEAAIRAYRARHGITSPLRGVNRSVIPEGPFRTTDPMAFWRKSALTG